MAFMAKYQSKCKACGGTIQINSPATKVQGVGTIHLSCIPHLAAQQGYPQPSTAPAAPASVAPPPSIVAALKAKAEKQKAFKAAQAAASLPAVTPKTQKAKGISVLQANGLLAASYAQIATTPEEATAKANVVGLPCFARPCPITPRHGFVDSRPVETEADVLQVWSEAKAADPLAELILMPFISASHNMVWRPGMLSVGPGHDGATAGHDSISVMLQPDYSQAWRDLATAAGCDLAKSDPFLEAVSGPADELVMTQIRAGVKGCPTAPNWNPSPFVIGEVITIDPAYKEDPGAMLAWEETAGKLTPQHHVVYNPGGNLGDHWSVHAQLHGIAVVTDFVPKAGQLLDKMGIDLVPLDAEAIVWGFLGGLLGPSLLPVTARRRAVACAVLGVHHGLRMGGDAGVYIGTSVALMLRLAQAALWGEARHKDAKGLPREQVYSSILDNWLHGRSKLKAKIDLFFLSHWAGGYGGPAWAACGQATAKLDAAMLTLIKQPTEANAKALLGCLNTVVNLAHNNGWWLNKFADTALFDYAADLDPRVAMLAGPMWYDATQVPADQRMSLLSTLQTYQPIDLSDVVSQKGDHLLKLAKTAKPSGKASAYGLTGLAIQGAGSKGSYSSAYQPPTMGKVGHLGDVKFGGAVQTPWPIAHTTAKGMGSEIHCQLADGKGKYVTVDVSLVGTGYQGEAESLLQGLPTVKSLAGTNTDYKQLSISPNKILMAGSVGLLALTL